MITLKGNKLFHPFEMSFCGHSGSGKTTLITRLIERNSNKYQIGYMKHDAHKFDIDIEGKDTHKAKMAGAKTIGINSPDRQAFQIQNPINQIINKQLFIDDDFIYIEGYKNSLGDKILVWTGTEEDQNLLSNYLNTNPHSLKAIVTRTSTGPNVDLPIFHIDDIESINKFVFEQWSPPPINGLILNGGRSKRMGREKGKIQYYGRTQIEYLFDTLSLKLNTVFCSIRPEQDIDVPCIKDRFSDFGPVGGILSAFLEFPNSAFLVLACDMPFINEEAISFLLNNRDPFKMATCFNNPEKKWDEPLFTIYEPKASIRFWQLMSLGVSCPRKLLYQSRVKSLQPLHENILLNINTPQEFNEIKDRFR